MTSEAEPFGADTALLRAILDVTKDINGAIRPDGTVAYVNAAASTIVGRPVDQIINHSMFDFIGQADQATVQAAMLTIFDGTPLQLRLHLVNENQELRHMEVRARKLDVGSAPYLLFSAHDVTDELEAENRSAESESRFRRLMDAIPDAVLVTQDQRIAYVNHTAVQLWGVASAKDLIKLPMTDLLHPDDAAEVSERHALTRAGATQPPVVRRIVRRDGETRWVQGRVARVNFKGRPAVLSIVREITEHTHDEGLLERTVSKLQGANAELSQFADTLTRDLNEPLRMTGGFLQLLKRKHSEQLDAESLDYIDTAITGVRRIEALIVKLKEFSRIHTHGRALKPLPLATVITAANKRLAGMIESSGFQLHHGELPMVLGDETQLVSVFCHLISNAIKYGPQGQPPVAEMEINSGDDTLEILFKDNGIGIDAHQQTRVFDVFRRLHPHGQSEGSGMGLATVKRIIERHGGRVWLNSHSGLGTTVHLTLRVPEN